MAAENRPVAILENQVPGLETFSDEAEKLSLLVYGKPGVGKTVLSGTAEDDERTSPVLYVDVEKGWQSISWRRRALRVFTFREFGESANRLQNLLRSPEGAQFKCVIIDSISTVGARAMLNVLTAARHSEEDGSDWTTWSRKMKRFIDMLRDADVHLIATALEREDDGYMSPSLSGQQVRQELPAWFGTVARLMPVTVPSADGKNAVEVRRLLLRANPKYMGKDRTDPSGKMPPHIDDPTIGKLLDRMDEGRKLAQSLSEQNSRRPAAKGA